jgi:hypothetical protein
LAAGHFQTITLVGITSFGALAPPLLPASFHILVIDGLAVS